MFNGTVAAKAYATLEKWIVGATFKGCKAKGTKVTCRFVRSGKPFRIVYTDSGKPKRFRLGASFAQSCTLDGVCAPLGKKRIRTSGPTYVGPAST